MMKRVTGKDVAARAGVTAATVSYVLSGSSKVSVSRETRQRVLAAAHELGYVPDRTAKSLRRRESKAIGVAIEKNLATPRYALALQGMAQAAARKGYRLTICRDQKADAGMADYLTVYYERVVDGVIFVGSDNVGPDAESTRRVHDDQIPFVALDCQLSEAPFGTVDFDYRAGARATTELLLSRRAGRVVYIRPEVATAQETLRQAGVEDACRAAGVPAPRVVRAAISRDTLASFDADMGDSAADRSLPNDAQCLMALPLTSILNDADVVVCSWAGWSGMVRVMSGQLLPLYADLASDLRSSFSADVYGLMPNYEAGEACVMQLVDQIEGAAPRASILPIQPVTSDILGEAHL